MIINEDSVSPLIINKLHGSTETAQSNSNFNYEKFEVDNKCLNVFEVTESLSDLFLSERCIVILTFKIENSLVITVNSVVRRLVKIAMRNLLPSGVMVLGLGPLTPEALKNISDGVDKAISQIQVIT